MSHVQHIKISIINITSLTVNLTWL